MPEQAPVATQLTLADCRRQLRSPDVRVRCRAVEGLAASGPEAEPLLQRALVDTSFEVRASALEAASGRCEFQTQESLLKLLDNPYADIREYAARNLGEVGDERALIPLMVAYRRCFPGGVPRKARILGPVLVISQCLCAAMTVWQWTSGDFSARDLFSFGFMVFWARSGLQTRGESWRGVLQAIMQVAERNPRPELHRLLPDLQTLATDRILIHPEAREIARTAAERIVAMTATIQDLPLPAVAPAQGSGALPVPSMTRPEQVRSVVVVPEHCEP